MDFYQLLAARRSIRNYKSDPVPREILLRLAEAARLAPTACNRQPFRLLLVTNAEKLAAIREACPQQLLKNAPVVAVLLGDEKNAWRRPEGDSIVAMDIGIVMEHLILAAASEGLGTCFVCAYNRRKMDAALGVEAPWSALALTPVGYASSPAAPIGRKPVEEILEWIE